MNKNFNEATIKLLGYINEVEDEELREKITDAWKETNMALIDDIEQRLNKHSEDKS